MSIKQDFIDYINNAIPDLTEDASPEVAQYWTSFCEKREVEKPKFTDNGKLILKYMQEHASDMPMTKAKDIGEGLLISSRTVSGALRKLVTDGYVEKVSENPVIYAITEMGKTTTFDD